MSTVPCSCNGCRDGRHSDGKVCRWCEGKGYVTDTDWPKPCWEGHYSGDLPPVRTRRRVRRPTPAPRTAGHLPERGSTTGIGDARSHLGALLAGRWLVRVESAGGLDLQDAVLSYVPHGESHYRVVSRLSGGWADGTWAPLNGSQILVDAVLGGPGLRNAPFRPTITFDVADGTLRATADGVRMSWLRQG